MQRFGKIWFFCTPTPTSEAKALVDYLHTLTGEHRVYEYQWSETDPKGPVHGWFQPNDHEVVDEIERFPGMTFLPSLNDPTPLGATMAQLLQHAGVTPNDPSYVAVKKLHDYHVTKGHGVNKNLRPLLY